MSPEDSSLILQDDRIVSTIGTLHRRIYERFPEAGLTKLCGQLQQVAERAASRSHWIESPIKWIRVVACLLATSIVLLMLAIGIAAFQSGADQDRDLSFTEFIGALESGVNEAIFISAAIYFLFSVENRIKRRRALAAIHELRSIAHIIDMHQLTKDPERAMGTGTATENSPKHKMTPFELNRYLDYCSEMLSLTGKIAAVYVRKFDDPVAVAAVSEVEHLTTGLSRKIWQKIMILKQYVDSMTQPQNRTAVEGQGSVPAAKSSSNESDPNPAN